MPGMLFALQVLAREIVTVCRCAKRALLRRWVTSFFICASLTRAAAVGGKFSTATGNPFFLFWPYPSFSHRPSLSGNCPWLYRLNCWPADSICKCGRQAALWLSAVVGLSLSLSLYIWLLFLVSMTDGWGSKRPGPWAPPRRLTSSNNLGRKCVRPLWLARGFYWFKRLAPMM